MDKMCKVFGIFGISAFIVVTLIFVIAIINMLNFENAAAQSSEKCKIYHDKAIELAEKGVEDLPQGITMDFDPRMAKSNASIAYSQIYRNCREYGE